MAKKKLFQFLAERKTAEAAKAAQPKTKLFQYMPDLQKSKQEWEEANKFTVTEGRPFASLTPGVYVNDDNSVTIDGYTISNTDYVEGSKNGDIVKENGIDRIKNVDWAKEKNTESTSKNSSIPSIRFMAPVIAEKNNKNYEDVLTKSLVPYVQKYGIDSPEYQRQLLTLMSSTGYTGGYLGAEVYEYLQKEYVNSLFREVINNPTEEKLGKISNESMLRSWVYKAIHSNIDGAVDDNGNPITYDQYLNALVYDSDEKYKKSVDDYAQNSYLASLSGKRNSLNSEINKAEQDKEYYDSKKGNVGNDIADTVVQLGAFFGQREAADAATERIKSRSEARTESKAAKRRKSSLETDLDKLDMEINVQKQMANAMQSSDFETLGKFIDGKTPDIGALGADLYLIKSGVITDIDSSALEKAKEKLGKELGMVVNWGLTGVTEDEVKTYYYIANTKGKEEAQKFAEDILVYANERAGVLMTSYLDEIPNGEVYKYASHLTSAAEDVSQIPSNIWSAVSKDTSYKPTGANAIVSAELANSAERFSKYTHQVAKAVSDLTPSLALGAVSEVMGTGKAASAVATAGKAIFGANVFSKTYRDAVNEGRPWDESIKYASVVTATEYATESMIGSTPGFGDDVFKRIGGGKWIDDVVKTNPKFGTSIKIMYNYGGDIASEMLQEGLSSVLDPVYSSYFFGDKLEFSPSEIWNEALIGGLVGAVLNAPGTAVSTYSIAKGNDLNAKLVYIEQLSNKEAVSMYVDSFSDEMIISALSGEDGFAELSAEEQQNKVNEFRKNAKKNISDAAAKKARQALAEEIAIEGVIRTFSEASAEGVSYEDVANEMKKGGIDISSLEDIARIAYDSSGSMDDVEKRLWYKGGKYGEINRLIQDGESTQYIADKLISIDSSISHEQALRAVTLAKNRYFFNSIKDMTISNVDKETALEKYKIKERDLDRMYKAGAEGLEFSLSLVTDVTSTADAQKAFIRGQNARQAEVTKQAASAESQMAKAPTAPVETESAEAFGNVKFEGETLDDSSIVLDKDLDEYSAAKQKVIDEYENYSHTGIRKFVSDVLSGKNTEKSLSLNPVKEKAANLIKKITGIDVSGFKTSLEDRMVIHIDERHGKNGTADQSMANPADMERIQYVLENFDDIVLSGSSSAYTTIKNNGFPANAKTVTYSKAINGTFYVVEAVPNTKAKTLQVVSAYIETKKDTVSSRNAQGQAETSETPSDRYPSNSSISQSDSDVNTVIDSMGSEGYGIYRSVMDGVSGRNAIDSYRNAIAHVYDAGLKGKTYKRSSAQPLKLTQINAIYDAAKKDAASRTSAARKENARLIKDDSYKAAKVSKREGRMLEALAKLTGRDIRFSDELSGNAKINLNTGEIIISTKAKTGVRWAAIHEVFHAMRVDTPSEANRLIKTVMDIINKNPVAFRGALELYADKYGSEIFDSDGRLKLNAADIIKEEMAADMIGYVISNSEVLSTITGEQRNILQRFIDKITGFFDKADLSAIAPEARQAYLEVYKEMDKIAEEFKAAFEKQTEVVKGKATERAENKKVPDDSGIRYSKNIDEISIKEQLSEHKSELSKMNVIANYNYQGNFKNAKEVLNWAISTLKNSGYKVERQNFGTVILDEKRLKNGLAYLDSEADYIAYALIPKIIKQGIVVGEHPNHKSRGYSTTTFGAPVSINGIRGNMAVVVRTEGKHYYKLHRVVMPNGGVFEYTEKSSGETAAATSNAVDTPTTTTSNSNYTQNNGNVNTSGEKNSRNLSGEDAERAEKNTVTKDGVKNSLILIKGKNKNYSIGVLLDDTLLDNLSESERIDMVKEYVKELGGSELIAYDSNNKEVKIKLANSGEKFTNKNGARVHVNKDLTSYLNNKVKQESIVLLDELVIASKYSGSGTAKHPHGWLDNNGVNNWEYWKVYIQDKNKTIWEATLNIANATNGEKYLYDIYPIKMVERAGTSATTTTNNNYTQNNGNVNTSGEKNSRDLSGEDAERAEKKTSGEEVNVRFSLSLNAKNDVRAVLNGTYKGKDVKLTDGSPAIMLGHNNVNDYPLSMKPSHIRENIFTEAEAKAKGLKVNDSINYHGLGEDLFFDVIDSLNDVKEAYRGTKNAENSERREDYFLLITEYVDKDKNVINVPVFINQNGMYNNMRIDVNKVATVFGRENIRAYINKEIKNGNLVRIKNRSTQTRAATSPIKAGDGLNASINNYTQKNGNVNTSDEKNSRDLSGENVESAEKKTSEEEANGAKVNEHVTLGMSEDERYKILKNKKIRPQLNKFKDAADIDFDLLENNIKSKVEKGLLKKFQEMGLLKTYTSVILGDITFDFTGKGFRKSLNSQESLYGGSKADFAKVVLNLQGLLDSSILMETHTDKGKGTSREKRGLEQVYVLFSVLSDNGNYIPVQFEVQQYLDNRNRLYLAVALTKIETGVMGNTAPEIKEATSLLPISDISISEVFKNINPSDENFLKYIPNQFLNEVQVEAKNRAIEKDNKKYTKMSKELFTDDRTMSAEDIENAFKPSRKVTLSFSNAVDRWLSGDLKSEEYFSLGNTPATLKVLGANDLPVVMSQDVIIKMTGGKHSISLDEIKRLPEAIYDPIMVFDSATVPNSFVIVTELEDKNGNGVVVALHLSKKQKRLLVNRVASVYGKENIGSFIKAQTELGNLKYINKEKSQQWSTNRGLQLPKLVQSITDNDSILQKEDIVNSILFESDGKYSKDLSGEVIHSDDEMKAEKSALLAEITSRNLERWGADIGRREDAPKMSIDEAVKKVKEAFGINITDGGDASVSGEGVSGAYNVNSKTIRTKFKNDLPSIAHALGYHIDETLKVVDSVIEQTSKVRELNGDGIGAYESELINLSSKEEAGSRARVREGFSEFMRMYLTSKNLAMEAAPLFYSYFESQLATDEVLAKAVSESAEAISGYFAQSFDSRASSAIMTAEEWEKLNKPRGKEAASQLRNWVATRLVDRFYGIKKAEKQYGAFDLSTSKNAYVKATLSLQARGRAARLLEDGFYDAVGNKVGESFFDIISPLGANYSDKFKAFGDYLTYVHAIEWLEPNDLTGKKTTSGKDIYNAKAKGKVFGDDTLNDANELRRLIAEYESTYPDFKSIAKKVYEYQGNLMTHYLIPSGALSMDQAEVFRAQYPHYVPFNRFNSTFGDATGSGKKGTQMFANLSNPIKKADGGNAPIRNPLESIINSTIAAVDFKMKNDTMLALIEEFTGDGSIPGVMERIYSSKELEKLNEKGQNPFVVEKIVVGKKNSGDRDINEIDISLDNELSKRIAGLSGSEKYNQIRDYIIENIGYEEFELSDGTKAKIDRSDALHIANKSAGKKTAYISQIKEIIKKARLYQVDTNVSHKKFNEFRYYLVNVKIDGEVYPIYLNVGKANNGDGYHLYDVTKKIGGFAKQNALERVNKDLRSEIEAPNNSISQQSEIVNIGVNESTDAAYNPTIDKEKGIVYAWVNGEKRFYQVYDRDLYNSVANLEVQSLKGLFKVFNSITNVLKVTMTMRNPLFGPGNFYRDFMTFHYNTTSNVNILGQLGMYVGAIKSIVTQDEDFKLYRALGGMDSSKFTADMDVIKRTVNKRNAESVPWSKMSARDFGEKVKSNLLGLKFLWDKYFELNDVLETLPRLAEFKYTMKDTKGDVNLAMYRSHDVTTNFSRSGTWGRNINAVFLFSNAELQGIDKMLRNYSEAAYTAKDKKGEPAKSKVAGKVLKTVGWSFFMTALMAFINRRDDEAEEEYARLSDFTKNNYDVFYIADGYFVKLPKEQNLALPRTFMQRLFDATCGDDLDLAELGSYIWDGITPDFIPDIFDIGNAPHQILNNTPVSVITDVAFNRDYKGDEIVPSYMTGAEYEKYNNYTSAFSVKFARDLYDKTGIDVSPMAIDHYIGAFGYYGSLATNLFPNADVTEKGFIGSAKENWADALGIKTKFKVDARYSTDLLDDFYEGKERASERLGIDSSGENRLVNEKYQAMSSFISNYNKQSRSGNEEQQRLDRLMLQKNLENFDEGNFSEGEQYVIKLYDETGNEDVFISSYPSPELKETKTKKGKKTVTTAVLDANTYAEFCSDIERAREAIRVLIRDLGLDSTAAAEMLAKEYKNINADMKARYLELYGKSVETEVIKSEAQYDEKDYEELYEKALDDIIADSTYGN